MKTTSTHLVAKPAEQRPSQRIAAQRTMRQMVERGMVTAEYAVGILAAVALALVLMKVFKADTFIDTIVNLVSSIFTKILGWLP